MNEAYDAKQWAFVSDYARFDILYRYGGLYFDTDVEVIKPIDDILSRDHSWDSRPTGEPRSREPLILGLDYSRLLDGL